MEIKRGQMYYIRKSPMYMNEGSEYESGRPGIIVSNDVNNRFSPTVEVVYLTTQPKKDQPTHVIIHSGNRVSTAVCEQVTTVSVERIGDLFGTCSEQEMSMIDIAIAESLGLSFLGKPSAPQERKQKQSDGDKVIKLSTELDLYKTLYNQLLERVTTR